MSELQSHATGTRAEISGEAADESDKPLQLVRRDSRLHHVLLGIYSLAKGMNGGCRFSGRSSRNAGIKTVLSWGRWIFGEV